MKATTIVLIFSLLIIFFQDWRFRKIHVVLPFVIFIISFFLIPIKNLELVEIAAYNSIFFLINLGLLTLYMCLKSREFLNPFNHFFGLGDLLFYIAVSPLFLLINYIIFFILSLVFSILIHFCLKKIIKENTVPLAGFSALLLLILLMYDYFLNFQKITLLQ